MTIKHNRHETPTEYILAVLTDLLLQKKEERIKVRDPYSYFDGDLTAKRNGKNWNPKLLCVFEGGISSHRRSSAGDHSIAADVSGIKMVCILSG